MIAKRMPWLVDAGLVLGAGLFLAGLFHAPTASENSRQDPLPVRDGAATTAVDANLIASTPLFGLEATGQHEQPKAVAATPSALQLKLKGTISGGSRPAAIIATSGNKQGLYYIGDTLQPSVTLQEIHSDQIIVQNRGKAERINIETTLPTMVAPAPVHTAAVRPMQPAVMTTRPTPANIALQLMPHFSGGIADGVMVGSLPADSIYTKTGLRSGDIIRKVNGKAITAPNQGMILRQVVQQGSAELEIVRNGQRQIIRTGKP